VLTTLAARGTFVRVFIACIAVIVCSAISSLAQYLTIDGPNGLQLLVGLAAAPGLVALLPALAILKFVFRHPAADEVFMSVYADHTWVVGLGWVVLIILSALFWAIVATGVTTYARRRRSQYEGAETLLKGPHDPTDSPVVT
jgi:hypothetical protein